MIASVARMVQQAAEHWVHVEPMLTPPETEEDYQRLVAALDELLDAGGADEDSLLGSLADRVGELVAAFEAANVPELNAGDGVDAILYLMEAHGLRQSDLPEIGNQGVVSQVLNRKRNLNARQMRALSRRFGVTMDVFAGP